MSDATLPNLAAAGLVGAGIGLVPAAIAHGSGARTASILGGAAIMGASLQEGIRGSTALGLLGFAAGAALAVYGGR